MSASQAGARPDPAGHQHERGTAAGPAPSLARGDTADREEPHGPAGTRRALPGWLVPAVPGVAELAVGGYRISGPSLWRDEAATIVGSQRSAGQILALVKNADAVHGPYYLLMHVVIAAAGTSETALRLPSLLAMSLAAALTAVMARRLARASGLAAPSLTGLAAGLALVAVPLTTRYAQEARPYALTSLFAVLASYLLIRAAAERRRSWWACYAAALALTGLFNLFAVLLAVAHGVSLAVAGIRAGSLRRWLAACAAAAVVLAPMAALSVGQSVQLGWVTAPDLSTVASLLRDFAGSVLLLPLIALLAVLGLAAGGGRRRGAGLTLGVLTLPWLVIPPVLLIAVSFAHPVYVERYVVFCLPALSMLVGAGLTSLPWFTRKLLTGADSPEPERARTLAVVPPVLAALIVAGALAGPQWAIRQAGSRTDDLRAVAATLAANERGGDAIVYLPWDTRMVAAAYPAPFRRLRDIELGASPVASATLRGLQERPAVVVARLRGAGRVWAVRWAQPLPGGGGDRTDLATAAAIAHMRLIRRWNIASVILSLYGPR